jgi:phage tail-like protein
VALLVDAALVLRQDPRGVSTRELDAPFVTGCFRVLIGDRELGFSDVGRLTSRTDEEHRHRFETVVLRRALTRSTELYDWRRRVVGGGDDRRQVTIHQLDAPGGRVVNTWTLVEAWPSRWSGPAFNALESGIAYEELELAFEDLVWEETTATEGA